MLFLGRIIDYNSEASNPLVRGNAARQFKAVSPLLLPKDFIISRHGLAIFYSLPDYKLLTNIIEKKQLSPDDNLEDFINAPLIYRG